MVHQITAAMLADGAAFSDLNVVSWNILAHVHTHWDFVRHGGFAKALETLEQRQARHEVIARRLNALRPEVALLQEVDASFLPLEWQGGPLPCGVALGGYTPYRSYSPGKQEGTAVLLRDDAWQRDTSVETLYIPRTEATGWKTGVVVHARRVDGFGCAPSPTVAFASVHLRHGSPEAQRELLAVAMAGRRHVAIPVVLGGDFNSDPGEPDFSGIEAPLLAAGLRRVPSQLGLPTDLSGRTIDHIYASPSLWPSTVQVGPLPPLAQGPWSWPPAANDGSDHAWLHVRFTFHVGERLCRDMSCGPSVKLNVMSWNVLAHIHTHWDFVLHGGSAKSLETLEQRQARHELIVSRLNSIRPEVALLQEVDVHFMPMDWQCGPLPCGAALEGYTPYRSYNRGQEGTVVLLRSDIWQRDTSIDTSYIKATAATGWKTGVVVHARRVDGSGSTIAFASVHLRWGSPSEQQELLTRAMAARSHDQVPMVLGGDFNSDPAELAAVGISAPLLAGGLRRIPLQLGLPTDASGKTIDHLYVSPSLCPTVIQLGPVPPPPCGPWSFPQAVHDGSDHAWLCAELVLDSASEAARAGDNGLSQCAPSPSISAHSRAG